MKQKTVYTLRLMLAVLPFMLPGKVIAASDSLHISVQVLPTVDIINIDGLQSDEALLHSATVSIATNDLQSFYLITNTEIIEIQSR